MTAFRIGVCAAILLAAAGCDVTPATPDAASSIPINATGGPVPTGQAVASAAQFDAQPCVVATADELRVAMNGPFQNVSGTYLRIRGKPAKVPGGCEFSFTADGTDAAEVYHIVRVTVTRHDDGAKLLSDCKSGPKQIPYGPQDIADESCLGKGSTLVLRTGTQHYKVVVIGEPVRADRDDEDTELAPLVKAAAISMAARLPRS